MRRVASMVVVFAMAMALSPVATGAEGRPTTWFVAEGGSDSGAGTMNDPWETIQHAVDSVAPGDEIRVLPGTYAGARIETSGTAANPITLAGSGAVIDRPGPDNKHDSNLEIETWSGDGTVSHWIIKGLEVKNAPNWGIDVRGNSTNHSHHITIHNNNVHHNGVASVKTGIFFAFVDDIEVTRNDSHHNGEHGIYLSNSGDRFKVKNNTLRQNDRCGLHMNGDLSQGGDGLISDGLVVANWIEDNGVEGCAGVNMDGVTDTTVRNNVIVENHASGIAIFNQDGAQCSRRNKILNNTVVQAADGRWALVIGGTGCINNTIRNNVLLTRHAFRGSIEMPSANIPGLFSNHNIVSDRFTVDDGASIINLAQWRSATGQDADSFVVTIDELFMDGSYRHKPGGAAEDAGATVSAPVGHDLVRRPSGTAFDIGAYETPYCNGLLATVIGTRRNDVLIGTFMPDVIAALNSNDTVLGREGDDVICGGKGNDELQGHMDNDILLGGAGDDLLRGYAGNDTIRGGTGTDHANGGTDTDTCIAETKLNCE